MSQKISDHPSKCLNCPILSSVPPPSIFCDVALLEIFVASVIIIVMIIIIMIVVKLINHVIIKFPVLSLVEAYILYRR